MMFEGYRFAENSGEIKNDEIVSVKTVETGRIMGALLERPSRT